MKYKFFPTFMTETQKYLLQQLAKADDKKCAMRGSENGSVQHYFDFLVKNGLAKEELGFYQITDAGRSRLRSNTGF